MKINTINVVEVIELGKIPIITSFSHDAQGNAEAKQHFRGLLVEYNVLNPDDKMSEQDILTAIEDGFYEDRENDYQVAIVVSAGN